MIVENAAAQAIVELISFARRLAVVMVPLAIGQYARIGERFVLRLAGNAHIEDHATFANFCRYT